jgi:hypothetical protein
VARAAALRTTFSVTPARGRQAREARRVFEAVLDREWSRRGSLWLDALVVFSEDDA